MSLLDCAAKPPGYVLPNGCLEEDIVAFERRSGILVPNDVRDWLKLCNGPCVGPGAMFGVRSVEDRSKPWMHFENSRPEYYERKWLPIACDGCGNDYCLPTQQEYGAGYPVFFIDHESDLEPTYIVASDIGHFLIFLLEHELESTEFFAELRASGRQWAPDLHPNHWPFCRDYVLERDPAIVNFPYLPLPWEAD